MSRKEQQKPPDSGSCPQKISRPADGPNLRGNGADRHLTSVEPSPSAGNRYAVLAVCAFLLLAVFVVFGQTVRHEFISLDDHDYVSENPHLTTGMSEGIVWALTHSRHYNWCPLTWWSYMLDYQLCGLKPWGYHLSNVLLHAATAILLFLVLRGMTGRLWPSALVAALFAIHPLRAESVAWVSERKDVLSGVFFMLTIGAYAGYARRRFSLVRYLTVLVFFALGLMAKPMLVTLPFVLLLLDYWPLGRMDVKPRSSIASVGATAGRSSMRRVFGLVVEKIPMLALAGIACGLTLWAQRNLIMSTVELPYYSRIGNVLVSYATYLRQFFCPAGLALWYPLQISNLQTWKILGCLGLLTIITVVALVERRRHPYVLVGWLWYVGMLVPAIGLVQVTEQAMADRFTYLPEIGIGIALVWWVAEQRWSWLHNRWICGVGSAAVVLVLMGWAWHQTSFWRDTETLWRHTLDCTTANAMAHAHLAGALVNRGRLDEAIAHYQTALKIDPDFVEAHNNLGNILANRGRVDEAIAHYQKALELKPDFVEAHNNLGNILANRGRVNEAIAHYQKALKIRPDFADACNSLGDTLAGCGRVDEAIAQYQTALKIRPNYAEAHSNLGNALAGCGRSDEAIAHYKKALKIKPDFAEVYSNLGNVLAGRGRIDEAIAQYKKALEINPNYAKAHSNFGNVLADCGRSGEAIVQYRKALEINPDFAEAHYNLGLVLAGHGQSDEAIAHCRTAMDLARQQNKQALLESIQAKIRLYEAGKPFHGSQASPAKTPTGP